jgi:hypothetical protein
MARWTDFGVVRSDRDLLLIQQSVDVQPAKPKLNLIDVPGADGSKDLTELPGGRVVYEDGTITWTYALQPGEPWPEAFQRVSGAINGRRCRITLWNDPEYYYDGRVTVKSHKLDGVLRQIVVEATCRPYKLRHLETTRTVTLGTAYAKLILLNDRRPVVPTIKTTAALQLRYKGAEYALNAGTHKLLDLELREGANEIEVKLGSGATSGTVTFTYQEGALY